MQEDSKKPEEDEIIEMPDMEDSGNEEVVVNDIGSTTDALETKDSRLKQLWNKYLEKKKITIPITILVITLLLLAVPISRYKILGLFIKKQVMVSVVDSKTGKPVSEADVVLAGKSTLTNGDGLAMINDVKVGPQTTKVTKKYYNDAESKNTLPIKGTAKVEVKLEANGRQVPVSVVNKITGEAVKGATIKSGESKAQTDDKGVAVLVLNPNSQTEKASVAASGYNESIVEVKVTDGVDDSNKFQITPGGKIYFLSKKSGKIDVVKTNLDGSDRKTVLAGSGTEDDFDTVLLASRDWKYLTLKSKREGKTKLYLIDTSNDKLSTIDDSDAIFTPAGWSDSNFVYTVSRNDIKSWQSKQFALKSFDAKSGELRVLDESKAEGSDQNSYVTENFGQIYILENLLVYAKNWTASYYSYNLLNGKRMSINSIRPDSTDKRMLRDFDVSADGTSFILGKLYKPQEVIFQVTQQANTLTYFEYENGEVKATTEITREKFDAYYPTYLMSPSGNKTFWSESRDGKNTLFVGGRNADNGKEIVSASEYTPYGWFTEDYLLVSKSGSELYIMPVNDAAKVSKITDYHKASQDFSGYGYGYGGF